MISQGFLMRHVLSATLLLVASTTATAEDAVVTTAQAVLSEVEAARKLIDPTAKAAQARTTKECWSGVAAGVDVCASSTSPRILALLQRAASLACGRKPAPLEDATRDVSALGANGAISARTQTLALLRGAASWARLPATWARLYQARSAAAGVASPAHRTKLLTQARKKTPAAVLKSVVAFAAELSKSAENPKIAAVVQEAARDYLCRPTATGDTRSHLASIGARSNDVAAFLKAAPRPAFPGAGPAATKPGADKPDANPTGPLVDHVKKGQTYTFVMVVDNAQMTMTTTSVWTVTDVTAAAITYDLVSTSQMHFKAAGMPTMKPRSTTTRGQKYPLAIPPPPKPGNAVQIQPVGTETVVVEGVAFECKIYENHGTRTWVTRRFPGLVKMVGKTFKQDLKHISGVAVPKTRPKTGAKAPKDAQKNDLDISKVKVGQKYHFKSEFDTPQMTIETDAVWTVTKITPTVIEYDMTSTTRMTMKNPAAGMPPMKPTVTVNRGQKVPILPSQPAGVPNPNAPKSTGTDLIEVDGQKFPCDLYEKNGIKSWVSKVFPFTVIVEKKGTPLLRLVRIEQP